MKRTFLVCLAVAAAAALLLLLIFSTEPTAERSGATRETAMLVEVVSVERGTHRPELVATGTVVPARDVVLSPRVAGQVVRRAPAFTPGGVVAAGEVLLEIDRADFENVLAQRESDLSQARADLELEMGRQDVARKDLELLDGTLGPQSGLAPENEALVLRRPQLHAAEARVAAAAAAVAQAELELARTAIRAPFDAHVITREADVGSQVAPGDRLGRLVGTEVYWVEVAVPLAKLRWVPIAGEGGEGGEGAAVRLRSRSAWPEGVWREGRVERLLGELAGETRMARLLVTVPDPLARRDGAAPGGAGERPPLILGSFLEARIEGSPIADVVRLDRDHLRKGDTVWVMDADGELDVRRVEVVFRDARWAYVGDGLADGDRVVTTNLSTVVEGAGLRLEGDS